MQTPTIEKVWLTYPEASRRTGLSETSLWRAMKSGSLRASGRGRGVRFHRDALDEFMESRGQK